MTISPATESCQFCGADEKNRTSTPLREQASETCASTSSATSARAELSRILISLKLFKTTGREFFSKRFWYSSHTVNDIEKNVNRIKATIEAAAKRAGRGADQVKLVAVSKNQPIRAIRSAIEAGIRIFGENRVQEAAEKIPQTVDAAEWHLIGHLQSNKARRAAGLFTSIQTVDSIALAARLNRICREIGRAMLPVLIQVDLAGEATKSGIGPAGVRELASFIAGSERLRLDGLMTVPPYFEVVERVRPYFRRLREIRDELATEGLFAGSGELSMGMSHDFEVAIEEGATIVRIGTAIFGERNYGTKV